MNGRESFPSRWKEKQKFVLPEVTTKMGKILQEILVLNT